MDFWGPDALVSSLLAEAGVDATDMKPLFAMEPQTGSVMKLFEAGATTQFYLLDPMENALHQINEPDTLEAIVELIGDENQGVGLLDMEQIV